ncbi:MAG: hypothetical protein IT250_00245 [Chitinophagaceae bacterium]|nr:hypothetical protein [Chitinophagaceae bacterium]
MEDVLVPISFFLLVFGIVYVFLSLRNKERLALIEKGVDAGVFFSRKRNSITLFRIIVLNVALLLMGVGVGVSVALLIGNYNEIDDLAPLIIASIFTMAGLALLIGFFLTKKMDKQAPEN